MFPQLFCSLEKGRKEPLQVHLIDASEAYLSDDSCLITKKFFIEQL